MLSTGVIGVPLPLDRVVEGTRAAVAELSPDGGEAAAAAILTTDSGPKVAVAAAGGFTVGGMAKGAGMIHPRLATMLVVITTDYPLAEGEAETFLRPAVEASFNRISVDGDCSTNDARRAARERRERRTAGRRRLRPARWATCAGTSPGRSWPTARAQRSCSRSG